VSALIATSHLVRAANLGKHSDVDVLDVGSGDANGYDVLGLARGRAGMTTDAACVVYNFGPLHGPFASYLLFGHFDEDCRSAIYQI